MIDPMVLAHCSLADSLSILKICFYRCMHLFRRKTRGEETLPQTNSDLLNLPTKCKTESGEKFLLLDDVMDGSVLLRTMFQQVVSGTCTDRKQPFAGKDG